MINKLKNNITLLITTTLSFSILILLIIINIINISNEKEEIRTKLENLNNYFNNKNLNNYDETFIFDEYYIVNINKFGETTILGNIDNTYNQKELLDIINKILNKDQNIGTIKNFAFKAIKNNNNTNIFLIDATTSNIYIKNMIIYSQIIYAFSVLIIFIISKKISNKVIKPVEETINKQRNFISDASHELKTPLTIIATNIDLLKNDISDNKWLNYIENEVIRMSNLIKNLLDLTKVESTSSMSRENISEITQAAILPFESLTYEKNIKLITNIEKDLFYQCNKEEIINLITILVDNAIKHTASKKTITLDLERVKNKIELTIKNQGKPIPISEREKIFERFYRIDKSRSRKEERYGLGLAIAKSIVEKHSGTIEVDCIEGWTIFKVTFKN